jgi:hypothetical protein
MIDGTITVRLLERRDPHAVAPPTQPLRCQPLQSSLAPSFTPPKSPICEAQVVEEPAETARMVIVFGEELAQLGVGGGAALAEGLFAEFEQLGGDLIGRNAVANHPVCQRDCSVSGVQSGQVGEPTMKPSLIWATIRGPLRPLLS